MADPSFQALPHEVAGRCQTDNWEPCSRLLQHPAAAGALSLWEGHRHPRDQPHRQKKLLTLVLLLLVLELKFILFFLYF